MNSDTRKLLEAVQQGTMSVDEALLALKKEPFADIGYAKVDMHRGIRQGAAEVIYGAGKTPAQILGIAETMRKNGVDPILITRISAEAAQLIGQSLPMVFQSSLTITVMLLMMIYYSVWMTLVVCLFSALMLTVTKKFGGAAEIPREGGRFHRGDDPGTEGR